MRELGVRALVSRIVNTILGWGSKDGYFQSAEDAGLRVRAHGITGGSVRRFQLTRLVQRDRIVGAYAEQQARQHVMLPPTRRPDQA
jgi:hypothetical protein